MGGTLQRRRLLAPGFPIAPGGAATIATMQGPLSLRPRADDVVRRVSASCLSVSPDDDLPGGKSPISPTHRKRSGVLWGRAVSADAAFACRGADGIS
jgi:hypothetical protein